jgi:putative inorganic carbon (hco3(-)) transporter
VTLERHLLPLAGAGAAGAALAVSGMLLAYETVPYAPLLVAGGLVLAAVIAARPMAGVYVAVLVLPLEYLDVTVGGAFALSATEALLALTAGVAVIRFALTGSIGKVEPALAVFAALVATSLVGVTFAEDPFTVARITTMWAVFLIVAVLVASASPDQVEWLLVCLAVVGGVLGAITIFGLEGQEALEGGAIVSNRAQASFRHPTALALFLLLTIPLALALSLRRARPFRPLLVAAGLAVAALLLTHTRGAVIGFAVGMFIMLWWQPVRRLAVVLIALTVLVASLNFEAIESSPEVTVVSERLATIASLKTRHDDRLEIWSKTPTLIATHPLLGVGQGNFAEASPELELADIGGLPYDHAHNVFLNIGAELGLIGLALLGVFLFLLARVVVRALRRPDPRRYPLVLALAAALGGLLVTSFTEYPLRTNAIMAVIMIEIGALIALERTGAGRGSPASLRPPAS